MIGAVERLTQGEPWGAIAHKLLRAVVLHYALKKARKDVGLWLSRTIWHLSNIRTRRTVLLGPRKPARQASLRAWHANCSPHQTHLSPCSGGWRARSSKFPHGCIFCIEPPDGVANVGLAGSVRVRRVHSANRKADPSRSRPRLSPAHPQSPPVPCGDYDDRDQHKANHDQGKQRARARRAGARYGRLREMFSPI